MYVCMYANQQGFLNLTMYIRLSSGENVKVIPFYPVACLGHMISNGRRMAVTRQRFEVFRFPVT